MRDGWRGALALVWVVWLAAACRAAAPAYPLRYRFAAGQSMVYETRGKAQGRVGMKLNGEDRHPHLVLVELAERTRYTVRSTQADGSALVEAQVMRLLISPQIPGQLLFGVEKRHDDLVVRTLARTFYAPLPDSGQPPPPEMLAAFSGFDPGVLLAPVTWLVTPTGQTTLKSGVPWPQRLSQQAPFGSLVTFYQPFATPFVELPGRPLELGQEWEQSRRLPLPGNREETYGLDVLFALDSKRVLGRTDVVHLQFEGAATVQDRPLKFVLPAGAAVPAVLEALSHHLKGFASFAYEQGRLLEQHLRCQVSTASAVGAAKKSKYTLESVLEVDASQTLLPE
jgi:hypothetical protein